MGQPRERLKEILSPNDSRFVCRSLEELPDAEEQLRTYNDLVNNTSSLEDTDHLIRDYQYAIDQSWFNAFLKYLGLAEGKTIGCTSPPGSMTMNVDPDRNLYVDGPVWRQLVQWYGVSPTHQLDRRRKVTPHKHKPRYKDFKVGFLNGSLGRVRHRVKSFNLGESVGYVEFQIRRILNISRDKRSRLWLVADTDQPMVDLNDRHQPLQSVDGFTHDVTYTLALEVQCPDGCWYTGHQGSPSGDLLHYEAVTQPRPPRHVQQDDIDQESQHIINDFQVSVEGVMRKVMDRSKQQLVEQMREYREATDEVRELILTYKDSLRQLEEEKTDLTSQHNDLLTSRQELQDLQRQLVATRAELEDERRQCDDMSRDVDDKVKVNVGGHVYDTTRRTLTSQRGSLLSVVFSGKYPVKQLQDGCYFFDRNGDLFKYILYYLREGEVPPDIERHGQVDTTLVRGILAEADYYNIQSLVDKLKVNVQEEFPFRELLNPFDSDEE